MEPMKELGGAAGGYGPLVGAIGPWEGLRVLGGLWGPGEGYGAGGIIWGWEGGYRICMGLGKGMGG